MKRWVKDRLADVGIVRESWAEERADELWRAGKDEAPWRVDTSPFPGLDYFAGSLMLQRECRVTSDFEPDASPVGATYQRETR